MKTLIKLHFLCCGLFLATPSHAGRVSTSYNITAESIDGGGRSATSAAYRETGNIEEIVGISSIAAPVEITKAGYLGQLYEITALQITASPATINEAGTRQLNGAQLLDDLSTISLLPSSVTWSVPSGPLSISAAGLATGGSVFQNTPATAQGSFAGITGQLSLTVLDTIADNFGPYAGDALSDAWQVQYFGPNNPLAAPAQDPDYDGFDNHFEYNAGLIPTDPTSIFHFSATPAPNQPGQFRITFSPRLPGHIYTVKSSTDLTTNSWISLSGSTTTDNGTERTVTDPNASTPRKFYRIHVMKN